MVKKILLLSAALLFVTAGTATAQDAYPPPEGEAITVSDATPAPGQQITIQACCFQPGSTVTFTLYSQPVTLGTATADANGVATLVATIPSNIAPGPHTIEATGIGMDGQPLTVTQQITVVAPGDGTGTGAGDLPRTGSDSTLPMTQIAIAAIAGGGLLVLLASKRRKADAPRETAGV